MKEQVASFPDESENMYTIRVTPTGKLSPEEWLWKLPGIAPLLSVATGSVQVITMESVPTGTVNVSDSGHLSISGGLVSMMITGIKCDGLS